MSKKLIVLIVVLVAAFLIIIIKKQEKSAKHAYTVGLLQTASFPALDEAQKGFVDEIKKQFGDNVYIVQQNAQGSITEAQTIASSFQANANIDAFYAIATPAVQALKSVIKDRPIVFSAVTDPEGLHLRYPNSNITGSTDMANIPKQIELLVQLMPNLSKVAIVYNPGEPNSVVLVRMMEDELGKSKIGVEKVGVNSQADVAAATQKAAGSAQLILIPTDNTVSSAFPVVREIAEKAKVPVVTTWTGEKSGVLMQFGVDYILSGVQAAEIMKQILVDKKGAMDIPIVAPKSKILVSEDELKKFALTLPSSLKSEVTLVP